MALLEINNLQKTYKDGEVALKGVDLKVEKGQFVAVIGPSGAGKSTLIRCINQLIKSDPGSQIFLEKRDILSVTRRELRIIRRELGMIFQEFNLIERLTVMENVLSGRLGYTDTFKSIFRKFSKNDIDEAYILLERVGLREMVNKRATELSGGQRQRVGIARALIQKPKVLLADEPTSSLDPEIGERIIKLLYNIAKERDATVLINIHDVDLALKYSDRVIGLREGKKIFEGLTCEVTTVVKNRIYRGDGNGESFPA